MNIDVKRNTEGDWFYSFAIEKGSVPQTLLAAVTDESATLPDNNILNNIANVNRKLSLSEDGGGASVIGDNVYGHDVALESQEETVPAAKRSKVDYSKVAPTKEDIALMEQEKASQSEDGMQTLIRALDEIRTQSTRQDSTTETRAKAEKIVGDRNTVIRDRDVTNEAEPTATEGAPPNGSLAISKNSASISIMEEFEVNANVAYIKHIIAYVNPGVALLVFM